MTTEEFEIKNIFMLPYFNTDKNEFLLYVLKNSNWLILLYNSN